MKFIIRNRKIESVGNQFLRHHFSNTKPSSLRILVLDTNLALDHALRFAEDGAVVYYCLLDFNAFPKLEDGVTGFGFSGIVKVDDFGAVLKNVDLVYITDNCIPWLAVLIRNQFNIPVFGPTPNVAKLENDRIYAIQKLQELEINVPKSTIVKGIDKLIDTFDDGSRKFIKVNKFRGNIETFSASSKEEFLATIEKANFGPFLLQDIQFIVQEECKGVEIGCDGWINEKMLYLPFSYTIEEKGRGNIATWKGSDSGFVEDFYKKIFPEVEKDQYRCNLSVEGFWDGNLFRAIDVTCRNPYPVSSLYTRFVNNFTEMIYNVASGNEGYVEVDMNNPYLCELSVYTDECSKWKVIEIEEWEKGNWNIKDEGVGFRRAILHNGTIWFVPGDNLVATINTKGKTPEEALQKAVEYAHNKFRCSGTQWEGQIVDSMLQKIAELDRLGDKYRF